MVSLRSALLLGAWLPLLGGCQLSYFTKSAYHQLDLLNQRIPIETALKDPNLKPEYKKKLELTQEVRQFCAEKLGLNIEKNYTSFVDLKRPYVTYVVSAAHPWELEHHEFKYPIVGKMPYKGFFIEADAQAEEQSLKKQGLDTYLRGVTAYSTLGWFKDPVLSSMLEMSEHDFINTLIHETVHATLYIKNSADFNEQLATFLGNKGTELFYLEKEGPQSPTLQIIRDEQHDDLLFAQFIESELKLLTEWYASLKSESRSEESKEQRLREIQNRFQQTLVPQLKTSSYQRFSKLKLNNARLMVYKTYMHSLDSFALAYEKLGGDFKLFMEKMKTLEKSESPEQEIVKMSHQ